METEENKMDEDYTLKRGDLVKGINDEFGIFLGWIDKNCAAMLDLENSCIVSGNDQEFYLLCKEENYKNPEFLPREIKLLDIKPEF